MSMLIDRSKMGEGSELREVRELRQAKPAPPAPPEWTPPSDPLPRPQPRAVRNWMWLLILLLIAGRAMMNSPDGAFGHSWFGHSVDIARCGAINVGCDQVNTQEFADELRRQ